MTILRYLYNLGHDHPQCQQAFTIVIKTKATDIVIIIFSFLLP
jgi:hypothetical protein